MLMLPPITPPLAVTIFAPFSFATPFFHDKPFAAPLLSYAMVACQHSRRMAPAADASEAPPDVTPPDTPTASMKPRR